MKSLSLARVLPVLDAPALPLLDQPRPELHIVAQQEFLPPPVPFAHEAAPEPATDLFAQGYEAGLAAAHAEIAQIAVEREGLVADAVESARQQWAMEEANRIAGGVEKALAIIEAEVCSGLERVLGQLVESATRNRALREFVQAVETLLRGGEASLITIHAPADLAAALEERLKHLGGFEIRPHESAEVWVRAGQTLIETRLAALCENLRLGV